MFSCNILYLTLIILNPNLYIPVNGRSLIQKRNIIAKRSTPHNRKYRLQKSEFDELMNGTQFSVEGKLTIYRAETIKRDTIHNPRPLTFKGHVPEDEIPEIHKRVPRSTSMNVHVNSKVGKLELGFLY